MSKKTASRNQTPGKTLDQRMQALQARIKRLEIQKQIIDLKKQQKSLK